MSLVRSKITVARMVAHSTMVATISVLMQCSALAADTTSDAPSSPVLKGNVVELSVTLNNLRDARLSISRVRKAAANLYDEVTRQQMSMSYNPNVIGTTVIMTPAPSFSGQILPARKKWVDASIKEMGPIISLFKEDVDVAMESNRQTDVNESTREALNPLKADAFEAVGASFESYKKLEALTSGAGYDNDAIASEVKSLDGQMKKLDRSLKNGISVLQKAAKAAKKAKA